MMKQLVLDLLRQKSLTLDIIARFKREYAKKNGPMVRNSDLLLTYKDLVKRKLVKPSHYFENALRLKKVRSLSGIVPIAVLTKPYPCPGKCVYCPTQKNMPKSYLNDEPAVLRAIRADFDPYLQVKRRIKQLEQTGHNTDKIELIVMGGSFSSLPRGYKAWFISNCFAAANGSQPVILSETKDSAKRKYGPFLEKQQRINEKAKHRIVGLTLETRPDLINQREIEFMRKLGATRVEIGVQSIYDEVLKKIRRGHLVKSTIKATRLLKNAGLKICYHMMPNLPRGSLKKDYQMFKTIFTNSDFMPDMIKIYPCVVCYQAKLYDWYKKGEYQPYSDQDLINLLIKIKKIVPKWVRINRLGRDIPIGNISGGNKLSNIRQIVQQELKDQKVKCNCIRCREIRNRFKRFKSLRFKVFQYLASEGIEYFLQYADDDDGLYALLRLRITKNKAIIRELHTYGLALSIKKVNPNNPRSYPSRINFSAVQHEGLGKKLLKEAELITRKNGYDKLFVISGVGVRDYYRKLGYKLQNYYMVKDFKA